MSFCGDEQEEVVSVLQAGENLCWLDVYQCRRGCVVLRVADDRMFLYNIGAEHPCQLYF